MSDTIAGAGVELAYAERGSGAPLVLVHDLAGDDLALEPLATLLAHDARVIAYSRRGYRGSGRPEPYAGTTVVEQAEDLAALLGGLDAAGALAVADGFGALAVLDLLKRRPGQIDAAVLVDPPLFAFVPEATRALSDERAKIETAVFAGGPAAGVAVWLDAHPAAPADRERALAAHQAFFADYSGLATWPVTRRELRAIAVPVVVQTRTGALRHVTAAADALAELLPLARRTSGDDLAAGARELLTAPRAS